MSRPRRWRSPDPRRRKRSSGDWYGNVLSNRGATILRTRFAIVDSATRSASRGGGRRSVVRFRSAESSVRALERGFVLADSRPVVRVCPEMSDFDQRVRAAAFAAMERLCLREGGRVSWEAIDAGFEVDGQKIRFASKPRGIFKPRQLEAALSIKTTVPKRGRRLWYRDQVFDDESQQEYAGLLRYELAHGGLADSTNRALRNAWERKAPLIYFAGVEPSVYQPVFPVWIESFRPEDGYVLVATADFERHGESSVAASLAALPSEIEATYSLRLTRNRNHQAWFSMRTKAAYGWRCAFSGLPVRELLGGRAHRAGTPREGWRQCATESACRLFITMPSTPTCSASIRIFASMSRRGCATGTTATCWFR